MHAPTVRLRRYHATVPWAIAALALSITVFGNLGPTALGVAAVAAIVFVFSLIAANFALVYRLSVAQGELRRKKYVGFAPETLPVGSIQRVVVGAQARGRMLATIRFVAGGRTMQIQPQTYETVPLIALLEDLRAQGIEVEDGVWAVVEPGASAPEG